MSALPFSAFSQTDSSSILLDTVVVTAKPTDESFQTGDVDLSNTPVFHTEIKRESFEGKMEDLSEVLSKQAGVQIRKTGGFGSYASVSVRGSSSEQVMIFLDGVLLNDAAYGGVNLSNISLSDVESIEIFRGVTPLNFGKASIGGVINIKTIRSKKEFKSSITGGGGSFGTMKAGGFINHKPGRWDYLVSADWLKSDNDFWILNNKGTDFNPYDDKWERRNNNALDEKNILAKTGFDFTGDVRLDASFQLFDKDQELPTWNNLPDTRTKLETSRNSTIVKLTADNFGSFNMSGYVDYTVKEEEYDDRNGDLGLGADSDTGKQHNIYTTTSYGGHYFLDHITDYNVLSVMLDFLREEYETEDLLYPDRNPRDSSRNTFTAGVQDTVFLFSSAVSITPAIRFYRVEDKLLSAGSSEEIPLQGKEETKHYTSPQMGIKYRISESIILKSNIARYTREPTFFELFGDRGFMVGNPDLEAEKGLNWDFGFLINFLTGADFINSVSFSSAAFFSDVDDMITQTYNAQGFGKSINVPGAEIKGIEAEFSINFLRYFHLTANGTWQDTENNSSESEFSGKQLPGRFRNSLMGRIEAKNRWGSLYTETVYESGMYYDTANLLEAENKNETNVGGSLIWWKFLFTAECRNIRNQRYEAFNGYPMPGRAVYLTAKYTF